MIIGFGIINANMAIRAARQNSIPFVYYIIDELHQLVPEKRLRTIARSIERSNMKRSDAVIAINEGLKDYSIMMGADPKRTTVIRAGVDLERFVSADRQRIRKDLGIGEKDTLLFFMGWLYDFSGLREVAMDIVRSSRDDIKDIDSGKRRAMGRAAGDKEVPR